MEKQSWRIEIRFWYMTRKPHNFRQKDQYACSAAGTPIGDIPQASEACNRCPSTLRTGYNFGLRFYYEISLRNCIQIRQREYFLRMAKLAGLSRLATYVRKWFTTVFLSPNPTVHTSVFFPSSLSYLNHPEDGGSNSSVTTLHTIYDYAQRHDRRASHQQYCENTIPRNSSPPSRYDA